MELWQYFALAGLGVVAGVINVMAGGGSLLTMPAMIFFGFDPALANGTNRVALVAQNVTAVGTFAKLGYGDRRLSLSMAALTIPGAVAGAWAAIAIDPLWFKRLLAVVMVGVLLVTLKKPKSPAGMDGHASRAGLVWAHAGMFGVGVYGGFIQAGVGFIIMALLRATLRLDLVRVNAHKVFVVGVYMLPSLLVFALQGRVDWLAGGVLAIGTATGAFIATRLQVKKGEGVVRVVFALAVVAMAVRLVWG